MFANKYKINLSTLLSGTTATTIDIPLNMEYQIVDQAELVETVFVDVQTQAAINPIVDYEKVRFLPLDLNNNHIDKVIFVVDLSGATDYAAIGFTDADIAFETAAFTQTYLNLNFYDSDNPLSQNLISYITLYSELKQSDLIPLGSLIGMAGQPKPAAQIPITYVLESPMYNPRGFAEGYYLYDYKDELNVGDSKFIYMRASFNNAKTGQGTNMMVQPLPLPIDQLVHELYTRYIMTRTSDGYYYEIDNTYQGNGGNGPNNVTYTLNPSGNIVTINLFKILAL